MRLAHLFAGLDSKNKAIDGNALMACPVGDMELDVTPAAGTASTPVSRTPSSLSSKDVKPSSRPSSTDYRFFRRTRIGGGNGGADNEGTKSKNNSVTSVGNERFLDDHFLFEDRTVDHGESSANNVIRLESLRWMQDMNLHYVDMLNELLGKRDTRLALVSELSRFKEAYGLRVRFCAAVKEFANERNAEDKSNKGKKIVEVFVSQNSLFYCGALCPKIQARLCAQLKQGKEINAQDLLRLKDIVCEELCRVPEVKTAIVKVFGDSLTVVVIANKPSSRPASRWSDVEADKE